MGIFNFVAITLCLSLIFIAHQKCVREDGGYRNVSKLSSTHVLPIVRIRKEIYHWCFNGSIFANHLKIPTKETDGHQDFKRVFHHQTRKADGNSISREICLLIFTIAYVVWGFYRSFKNESTEAIRVGWHSNNAKKCENEFNFDLLDYFKRTPKHVISKLLSLGSRSVDVRLHVYPSSLGAYVKDVSKHGKQSKDLMKYEWARYESFKHYPESAAMTPMRLSQAGFYYTGNDVEVRCFQCGLTTRQFVRHETALQIHRRLSPECGFINGTGSGNVSIHDDCIGQRVQGASAHVQNGACGKCADLKATTNGESEAVNESNEKNNEVSKKESYSPSTFNYSDEESNSKPKKTSESVLSTNARAGGNGHIHNFSSSSSSSKGRQSRVAVAAVATQRSATLDLSSVKQHQYMSLDSRISSFAKWPSSANQDPARLAEAGFYYAGFGDCVRCFYCGCGLRNWETTDDPWVEHSRWQPSCGYITLHNGKQATSPSYALANNGVRDQAADDQSRNGAGGADKTSESIEVVIEMGYSRERVMQTVQMLSSANGTRNVSAQAILEALFDEGHEDNAARGSCDERNIARDTDSSRHTNLSVASDRTMSSTGNTASDPKSLSEECQRLRDQILCKVCLDRDVCMVFQPCGHMVTCSTCSVPLRKCPICRKLISRKIKAFQS